MSKVTPKRKEQMRNYNFKYYRKHRDDMTEDRRINKNLEIMNEINLGHFENKKLIKCACGQILAYSSRWHHFRAKRHQGFPDEFHKLLSTW